MSRVGKNPVEVPGGVEIAIKGGLVSAKGKLGVLDFQASDDVEVSQEDGKVWVKPANDGKRARAMWGTVRSRIQNMVIGVSEGFTYDLSTTITAGDCTAVSVTNVRLNGALIQAGTTYSVTVNSFLADGGDNFSTFATIPASSRRIRDL